MKVTGYKIMQALKELAFTKETAEGAFTDSLWKFAGEEKPSPWEAMDAYKAAETAFAKMQAAQALYNQSVIVKVNDLGMTLSMAIKLVGGAGRIEKHWRTAAKKEERSSFFEDRSRKRDEGTEYAKKTILPQEAQTAAKAAAKYAAALREAIQTGNAIEIEMEGMNPGDFE